VLQYDVVPGIGVGKVTFVVGATAVAGGKDSLNRPRAKCRKAHLGCFTVCTSIHRPP
jgi:hypothetical protein